MKIDGINSNSGINPNLESKRNENVKGFGEMFSGFIEDVKSDQNESVKATKDFVQGKDIELHDVMIAGQKASTSLELLIQIRNKAMDMYQQITRMQ